MQANYTQIRRFYKQLLPELEEDAWQFMESLLTVRTMKKGEVLFHSGDYCRNVSFMNFGLCRLYYLAEGKEVAAAFFRENEYLSEYTSFLLQTPALMSADMLEDSELIELSYDSVQMCYAKIPAFQKFGRLMAEGLFVSISERTHALLVKTPEQRYLEFIANSSELVQRVPQYMIASYLGVTPEALSRIRKRLAGTGS